MCQCWRRDVMEVAAKRICSCVLRGRSARAILLQRVVVYCKEDLAKTLGDQRSACSICRQLAHASKQLQSAELREAQRLHSPTQTTRWPSRSAFAAAWILDTPQSSCICGRNLAASDLPKCSLPDARRAENLRHLASHIPARDIVARKTRGCEQLVELRDACRYSASSAGMEALECLRCGDGGQSV
jgi:hypothetical protein